MLCRRGHAEFYYVLLATDQPGSSSLSSDTLPYFLLRRHCDLADSSRPLPSVVDKRLSWYSSLYHVKASTNISPFLLYRTVGDTDFVSCVMIHTRACWRRRPQACVDMREHAFNEDNLRPFSRTMMIAIDSGGKCIPAVILETLPPIAQCQWAEFTRQP